MNFVKKIMILSLVSLVVVTQPVMAKKDAKSLGTPLLLLAATGGLGYVAKKAYSRMKQASTAVEREQAHRRLILAILGVLVSGVGTAYAGHGYLTDSSEEQAEIPQEAPVVSPASLTESYEEPLAAPVVSPASSTEFSGEPLGAPVEHSGLQRVAAAAAESTGLTDLVPSTELDPAHQASLSGTAAVVSQPSDDRAVPLREERSIPERVDLACLIDANLRLGNDGDSDFPLASQAAARIKAVLDRDRVSSTQFCESFMPYGPLYGGLYILIGKRRGSAGDYLYIFDKDGNQKNSQDYQNQFRGSSVVTAHNYKIFRGEAAINRRLDEAIDGSADAEIPVSTLTGNFEVYFPGSSNLLRISLNQGKISQDIRQRLEPFNLVGRTGLRPELARFPLVVRLCKHNAPDFMLCVDNQLNCQWFTAGYESFQLVTNSRIIQYQFIEGRKFTLCEPAFQQKNVTIDLVGNGPLSFVLDGVSTVRLRSERSLNQLYWDYVDLNWQGLPEVPTDIELHRSYKYPIVLNFKTQDGSTLLLGLGDEARGCLAVMDGKTVSNAVLQRLIAQELLIQRPDQGVGEVAARLIRRNLLYRIETEDSMQVAGVLLEDSGLDREVLYNFQGAGQSLVFTLLNLWDDSKAEAVAAIVECLQEKFPSQDASSDDWVERGANGRKPLCVAVGAGKPAMVQALLGIRHSGKTPASVNAPGNEAAATILHYAIYRAEPSMLEALFTPQATVEQKSARFAVHRLKEAINTPNSRGETPLMVAMQMSDFEYARVLLDNDADLALPAPHPQSEDILDYAAKTSTEEMFNQLCAHQRISQRGVGDVRWQPTVNPPVPVERLSRMQTLKSYSGSLIFAEYDANAGLMTTRGMQSLHKMNAVGGEEVERFGELQGYPLVVCVASYGKPYWMCVKARGEVKMFRFPEAGSATLGQDDGQCFREHGTTLHVIPRN